MSDVPKKIRIIVVDDQVLFRKGVRALLEEQPDFEVVGEADDGLKAIELARVTRPNAILMDINMPVCGGVEATRVIKGEQPDVKVVMLTISDDDQDLFEAIKSGAQGYLLKDLRPEALFDMLRSVMRGETPISPSIAGKLLNEIRQRPWRESAEKAGTDLTARELEVLQLVAKGLGNTEIAARLFIVEGTVKNHLHNILEKLHVENRVQAAAYAIREGLVEPPRREYPRTQP